MKMKLYLRDEDLLGEEFCESIKCSGEQPTESDNTGCCGCEKQDKYILENWNRVISESDKKYFYSKKEVNSFLIKIYNLLRPMQTIEQHNSRWKEVMDELKSEIK